MSHQSVKVDCFIVYILCNNNEHDFVLEDRFTGQLPESGWSNGPGSFHEG